MQRFYPCIQGTHQGKFALTVLGLAVLLLLGAAQPAAAAPICGPGPHWVDDCPPGTDTLVGDVIITLRVDNLVFDVDFLTVSTVTRSAPFTGLDPNDPNHASAINTDITVAGVVCDPVNPGFTCIPFVHPVLGNASISGSGPGMIIEKTGPGTPDCNFPADPSLACSFFDVDHVIFTDLFGRLRPLDPQTMAPVAIRMFTQIGEIPPPPFTEYRGINGLPVVLFDDNNVPRAEIIAVVHEIKFIPEPGSIGLFCIGASFMGLAAIRRRLSR